MCIDVHETRMDFRDPVRIARGFRLGQQLRALGVCRKHHLDQTLRPIRGFLRQSADSRARGQDDAAGFRRQFSRDGAKQRGLAGSVAPHETDAGIRGKLNRRMVNQ